MELVIITLPYKWRNWDWELRSSCKVTHPSLAEWEPEPMNTWLESPGRLSLCPSLPLYSPPYRLLPKTVPCRRGKRLFVYWQCVRVCVCWGCTVWFGFPAVIQGRRLDYLFKGEKHYNEVQHPLVWTDITHDPASVRQMGFIHSFTRYFWRGYFLGSIVCDAVRNGNKQAGSLSGSLCSLDEPCLSLLVLAFALKVHLVKY